MLTIIIISSLTTIIGYILGAKHNYLHRRKKKIEDTSSHFTPAKQFKAEMEEVSSPIDNSGVGIIYRPSPEELFKMEEDQATKDAKAAMAETFRNAPEPTV